jgi:cytochrome P450
VAQDLLSFLLELSRTGESVIRYGGGADPAYLVNSPQGAKHALVDNAGNYTKQTRLNQMFKDAVGDGILTSEGAAWRAQRSVLSAHLSRHQIASTAETITTATAELVERWRDPSADGSVLDVSREMSSLTLDIVLRSLFAAAMDEDLHPISEAIARATDLLATPSDPRFLEARRLIDAFAARVAAAGRAAGSPVLEALAAAVDADDVRTSDEILRDQIVTLILAGSETTANTLTWTWYLLALEPDVRSRLKREVADVLAGDLPRMEHLPRLRYTRRVFTEALRLYPSAWIMGRRARAADRVDGEDLGANAVLAISPYTMHRRADFWPRPDDFLPDRFEEDDAARPPFAFFPFGGGPRRCVGHNLAMIEGPLILAAIVQSFSLWLAVTPPVEPEALFVLRPRGGMPMVARTDDAPRRDWRSDARA